MKMRRFESEKIGMKRKKDIKHFRDLEVYSRAFDAAMSIFQLTKEFPAEERYSLVDQIRRSSRSVCANLAEGWRLETARRTMDEGRWTRRTVRHTDGG